MFGKILVPLDGSELAEKALPYATFLAQRMGGELLLVRAVDAWAATLHDALEKELDMKPRAEAELSASAQRLQAQGMTVEHLVYLGEAAGAIELAASSHAAGMIAMSTHGRSGFARWAYGSVAERVLRSSSRPVLLAPSRCETAWDKARQTIILPLDGSKLAEQAIATAKMLARELSACIMVVQVIEPPNLAMASAGLGTGYYPAFDPEAWVEEARPYAEAIARQCTEAGVPSTATTLTGYAAATIGQIAADQQAAAVVMASHGRGGLARLALGSVAVGVIQRVAVPVLVVRAVHDGT